MEEICIEEIRIMIRMSGLKAPGAIILKTKH